jgi:acyl-CoA synthetase (AMP-forming)/AMP-acid ligase II
MSADYPSLGAALESLRERERRISYLGANGHRHSTSFAELHQRALGILHHLQQRGLRRGDEVVLVISDNEQFIDAFWACLLGGLIAVPVAAGVSEEQRNKLLRVLQRLSDPYLYTSHPVWSRIGQRVRDQGEAAYRALRRRTVLSDDIEDVSTPGRAASCSRDDVAFVQFSSGSTSEPKGVVLTHDNLLTNIRDIQHAAAFTEDDVSLSWMPLTHDMGLIGFHLNMLLSGMDHCLMATEAFIRRPLLWLQAASEQRANVLCSPNFGYRHFLKSFSADKLAGVDLSQVRLIFNGAEPISPSLCWTAPVWGMVMPSGWTVMMPSSMSAWVGRSAAARCA